MPEATLYKVAYDEAVRALSDQQAAIESVRTRAGLLLSAAAVTTSFLGAQALQGGGSRFFSLLALATFVAVAAISLAILWPRGLKELALLFQMASGLLTIEVVRWISAIAPDL